MLQRAPALALALVAGLGAAPTLAQNIKASLSGFVGDRQDRAVVGAAVTVTDLDRELERTVATGEAGRFSVPALDPGRYQVEVTANGFRLYRSAPIVVEIGESPRLDIRLELGEITTAVDVAADAPSTLQTDDVKAARTFNAAEMNDLPNQPGFAGRNFYTQALTTPGVAYSDLAHRPFAVSGQRPRNNNYQLDSVGINDVESGYIAGRGVTEQVVSQEAVAGMEVLTHNFKAEHGRNSGSIVSLVSKSGSNDFHGSAFWYHNNSALRARNFFEGRKAKSRNNLAGFTLGGPIAPNRAFFFANFETYQNRGEDISTFRTLLPAERARAVPEVQPLVELYPESPNGERIFAAGVPRKGRQYTYLVRGDFALTDRQTLMVRNNYTSNLSDLRNLSGWVGHHVQTDRKTSSYTAHHTYTPSATVVNEARAGYMRFTQFDDPIEPLAIGDPAVNGEIGFMIVSGLSNAGTIPFMGKQQAQNVYSLRDDLTWIRGAHTLKFGTSIRRNHANGGNPNNAFVGFILFTGISDFLGGRPLTYNRNVGNPLLGLRRTEWHSYIQDDWRITPRLTLNLGLRYELNTAPTEQYGRIPEQYRFPGDRNNFAPRVGLAWTPQDKTVVRAGWGLFYNALEMDFIGLTRFNPPTVVNVSAFRPSLPDLLARGSQSLPSGLVVPSGDAATPYAQHVNFTIERELWNPATTLSTAYVGTFGTKLPRTRQPNGGDSLAQDRRPDPTVGVLSRLETSGSSDYHALQVGLNQRFSRLTLKGSYTWSKFLDDVSEFATGNTGLDRGILPLDETNLRLDRGVSDFHIAHMGAVSAIWRIPGSTNNRWLGGWSLSSITTLQSGRPYTLYSGTNNRTGVNNNRIFDLPGTLVRDPSSAQAISVAGGLPTALALEPADGALGSLGRNTERTDPLFRFNVGLHKDLPLTERIRAQLRVEAFNLFNTTNFQTVDNVLGVQRTREGVPVGYNPNFGRYTEAFAPRSFQLALRFEF